MSSRKVRIKDAYKGDAGRGRIRIDPKIISELKLRTSDTIIISNSKTGNKTAALLYPGKLEDAETNLIRIDSSLRKNISASIDDIVEICRIEASLADRITFAGLEESIILRTPQKITQILENRVITNGDILSFNAMGRRIDLIVVDYSPKTMAVRVHLGTKIKISEKTHKEIEELELNRVNYECIGGLDEEMNQIREIIELPITHPEIFNKLGIDPIKGLILHGPSGSGKTLLVRALRNEVDAHFIMINGPEIFGKYIGEAEENLRKVFEEAKEMSPTIIFINKIDTIAPRIESVSEISEKRILAHLAILMDEIKSNQNVFIIAETNRLDDIDDSIRRSGRFEREIEFKPPDMKARLDILKIHTRIMPLHEDIDLNIIAEKTPGFVGADLEVLIKHAGILSIREILPEYKNDSEVLNSYKVKMHHFLAALDKMKPSTSNL